MENKTKKDLINIKKLEHGDGFLLWRSYLIWKRKIESALKPHGITHIQFVLLSGISALAKDKQNVSQVELAKLTHCDVNMTSQVLQTLEKKKFVVRLTIAENEKSKYPTLTSLGNKKLKEVTNIVNKAEDEFFNLSDKKQDRFKKIMLQLLDVKK